MKVYIDLQKLAISKVVDATSPEYQGDINSNVFEILFFNFSGTNWFPTMSQLAPNGREAGDFEADALGQGETHDYTEDGVSYKRYTFTMGDTWVLMKGRSNLYVWYNVLEGSTLKKCVGKLNVMINESNDNYFISNPVFNPAVKSYIDSVASDIEDELNDKVDAQNATIASLSQASPSVFDTAANIQVLQENKGVAVATDTGYIWYWDTTITPNAYTNSNIQYNSLDDYVKHNGNQLQDSDGNDFYPTLDDGQVTHEKTDFMKNINLIDVDNCIVDAIPKWIGYNPDITDDANVTAQSNYVTTNCISCSAGEKYIFNTSRYQSNIYAAGSNKVVSSTYEVNKNTVWTVPNGICYFRLVMTVNGDEWNNDQWKTKAILVKGESLDDVTPYGTNGVKNLHIDIEDGSITEDKLSSDLKTIIVPQGQSYSDGEAIILLNFDGWDKNTFDIIAPYLKEKNIPFTIFKPNTGDLDLNDLRLYWEEYGSNFEFGVYTGQPSATYEGTTNYLAQFTQLKNSYDTLKNAGLPISKMCSYASGKRTTLTEYICKNIFNFKMGRTTDNEAQIGNVVNKFSIPCSSFGDDTYWFKNAVDLSITNNRARAIMTHAILNGTTITDTSYNISEANLKEWVDYLYSKVQLGVLKCMTFTQYYLYSILPHTAKLGQSALVYENDGKQHKYVYTQTGWVELTNYASYK